MEASSPSILVVDDEPAITEALSEALQIMGYRTRMAGNGRQALDSIQQERPDLVVLDVLMPQLDGLQVLQMLRANAATQAIPVIMLTALGSDADVVRGIGSGATMYLTKPVEIAKLAQLISGILARRRAAG